MEMKITKEQIKYIHILKNKLYLDEETYRDALAEFGVTSSKELNFSQARNLIIIWKKKAIQMGVWREYPTKKYAHLKGRSEHMATAAQLRKIEAMWAEVSRKGIARTRQAALNKFLHRIVGIRHIEWLHKCDVPKVIRALQQMSKQEIKA